MLLALDIGLMFTISLFFLTSASHYLLHCRKSLRFYGLFSELNLRDHLAKSPWMKDLKFWLLLLSPNKSMYIVMRMHLKYFIIFIILSCTSLVLNIVGSQICVWRLIFFQTLRKHANTQPFLKTQKNCSFELSFCSNTPIILFFLKGTKIQTPGMNATASPPATEKDTPNWWGCSFLLRWHSDLQPF